MLITTDKAEQLLYRMSVARKEGDRYIAIPAGQTYLNPDTVSFGIERLELMKAENRVVLPLEVVMQAVQDYLYRPAGEQGTLHLDEKAMLRKEETRMEINLELLQEKFKQLGLPDYLPPGMDKVLEIDPSAVSMRAVLPIEGEPVKLFFFISQDNERNFRVRDYEMHVLHSLDIPLKVVGGIDVPGLDERMKAIEWIRESSEPWYRHLRIPDDHPDAEKFPAAKAISDVFSLAQHGAEGEAIAEKLQMKHWYMTGLHDLIPDMDDLEVRHRATQSVDLGTGDDPTIQQTYASIMSRVAKEKEEQLIADLSGRMQKITWVPNDLDEILKPGYGEEHKQQDRKQWEQIYIVQQQLDALAATGPGGQEKVISLLQTWWQKPELSELVDPLRMYIPNSTGRDEVKKASALLEEHDLYLPADAVSRAKVLQMAAMGYYVAAQQEQRIIPAEHIDRYIVVEHENPRGMVYEIGHRLKRLTDTPDYETARKIFLDAVDRNNDRQISHLLLGQFRGEHLKLDYEGYPIKNTAMILANDHYKTNPGELAGIEYISVNPHESMALRLPVVVKIDLSTNRVQLYDGDFKPLAYPTLAARREAEKTHLHEQHQTRNEHQQPEQAQKPSAKEHPDEERTDRQQRRRRGRGI